MKDRSDTMRDSDSSLWNWRHTLPAALGYTCGAAFLVSTAFASNPAIASPDEAHDVKDIGEGRAFVTVRANDDWQPAGFENALILHAAPVARGPAIDGDIGEPAWAGTTELTAPLGWGDVRSATLRAVYTQKDIFIAVSWPDPTLDDEHHPWVWDANQGRYVEGPQIEDGLIISIEGGCDWNPSLLANQIYDFDAWRWLAARTDPLGQAVDADGNVQNAWLPNQGYVKYHTRFPQPTWNVKFLDNHGDILYRPWQGLERMYKRTLPEEIVYVRYPADGHPTPAFARRVGPPPADVRVLTAAGTGAQAAKQHPTAPQYVPLRLHGDAGEVAAKGRWENGRWTVEFRRALVTEARTSSDSMFQRTTQLSVHIFDHTEKLDESSESGRIFLQFDRGANSSSATVATLVTP